MLKSKDSYANERAYSRAFFLHNSHVTDYPIDPLVGSFIRVIRPREDQPMGNNKGYHTRPQVVFFGNGECSRFYELTEAPKLKGYLETMIDIMDRVPGEVVIKGQDVFTNRQGSIFFKTNCFDGGSTYLVTNPASRDRAHKLAIIDNLLDVMDRIVNNLPPKSNILQIENTMMAVVHYQGNMVRDPVIISGSKLADRENNYVSIRRDKGILVGLCSSTHSPTEYFTLFLDGMKEASERLLKQPDLGKVVQFTTIPDINMEYVNARYVETTTGPLIDVLLNSDRYFSSRKLALTYQSEFHDQFRSTVIDFCKQFVAL